MGLFSFSASYIFRILKLHHLILAGFRIFVIIINAVYENIDMK